MYNSKELKLRKREAEKARKEAEEEVEEKAYRNKMYLEAEERQRQLHGITCSICSQKELTCYMFQTKDGYECRKH